MLSATDLLINGKLNAQAIDAAPADGDATLKALTTAANPEHAAALAIIVGKHRLLAGASALVALLSKDGIAGKAAAWSLGQLAEPGNAIEQTLIDAIAGGNLDIRENGYHACAVIAARGVASPGLATAMSARVLAEIERAKTGGSGLGEHACRVLAVLGAPTLAELIQQVIENDRYCDRFELQRLRKATEEGGRDLETLRALTAPWTTFFADGLPQAAPPPVAPAEPAKPALKPTAAKSLAKPAVAANKPPPPAKAPLGDDAGGDAAPEGEASAAAPQPLNWPDFLASPEAKALPAQLQQMAAQLGPLLEQLSARAIQAPLNDLTGQEFIGLLLQVLPQALPPQHVQMALSPQAITCYQALAKYLARSGLATHGDELVEAVKLVRKELTNQMRQTGMLGGPDYSDPDAQIPPAKPG